ncbi:MAG: phosphoglucosamine mutase [Gammaproteobacteria bacterium]|nr:phosphoglucosamine mutase [Gammaproteobacteria bacterium]
MQRKYFGTDGVRGRVGEHPITPEFVLKLGWAAGKVLAGDEGGTVLIGKDTRISNYMFESCLEAGLIAAGLSIKLLGPMPTPGIAYLTRAFRAKAGIVISASHNPFYDNGIKFFSADGTKLADEVELQIEAMLDQPLTTVDSARLGKCVRQMDAAGRYIEFCKSSIPAATSLKSLKIVLDCAHGATYHVAPAVFRELGAEVIVIGDEPNGLNINEQAGSTHPEALQARVVAEQAHLGIAFDGDGDRVMMVDHEGRLVDGDELLYIIARDAKIHGRLQGGVVGTLMSNLGLELAFRELEIPFLRAKVGDRYVMEKLKEHGWLLGGESSGHIICLNANTTGDGIGSALQVLAAMVQSGATLKELAGGMSKCPQVLINVRLTPGAKPLEHERVKSAVREQEARLGDSGRVLLRPSGTEPLVRVMVEGSDAALVQDCAERIAEAVRAAL